MRNTALMEAVKQADVARVRELLKDGHDVNEQGEEQQWPALLCAAGQGDVSLIQCLLDGGADVWGVGRDGRTAYQVALAAGHADAVRLLAEAEEQAGGDVQRISSRAWETRSFCKCFPLRNLRRYSGWTENLADLDEESLVFVHQDYSVTKSIWHGEDVVFHAGDEAWKDFCTAELRFAVPHDLDLLPSSGMSQATA